jgi:hypothetical protein
MKRDRTRAVDSAAGPGRRKIGKAVAALFLFVLLVLPGARTADAEDITLQWDPSPSKGAAGYRVHCRAESGGFYAVEDVGNATRHVVRGLSTDERYVLSVTAYNAAGVESRQSNAVYWGVRPAELVSPEAGGCLLAAVAYGTPRVRDVVLLRKFRNRHLEPYALGRAVIRVYEWASPPLVDLARRSEAFRGLIRGILGPLAYALTHLWVLAAAGLAIAAGGVIGFQWRRRKKKAQQPWEGSFGGVP